MKHQTQLKKAETSTRAATPDLITEQEVRTMMGRFAHGNLAYTSVLTNQLLTASPVAEKHPQLAIGFGIHAFSNIGPRDGLEQLLVAQMIGCHNLAMEFMALAACKDQSSTVLDKNVSRAARFMDLFLRQIEGLKSYRSKGEQKVRVEHVQVNASAQAVVGCLNTESKNS